MYDIVPAVTLRSINVDIDVTVDDADPFAIYTAVFVGQQLFDGTVLRNTQAGVALGTMRVSSSLANVHGGTDTLSIPLTVDVSIYKSIGGAAPVLLTTIHVPINPYSL